MFTPCIFPIRVRFIDDQSMCIKKKCNDMFVYGILLHWALISPFEVYLLGIFVFAGSCEIFYTSFHSLSHFCYAFGVLGIHVRVL